jgi:hypothetical protein
MNDDLPYPMMPQEVTRIVCGNTLVYWDGAVVYVRNRRSPYDAPTHLHFVFIGSGQCYLDEIGVLAGQWTFYNTKCVHVYRSDEHEYRRAYRAAWKAVATYRKNYVKKHGSPPDPLGLGGEISPELLKRATDKVNKRLGYGAKKK